MSSQSSILQSIVWHFIRTVYENHTDGYIVPIALKYLITAFSKHIIDSNILTISEDMQFIQLLQSQLSNIVSINFKLLFRASEHNYSASKFHKLCDNHRPTLTIIKNEFNHIFGGYSSIKWSSNNTSNEDTNSFLFLIRSNCILENCPLLFPCINTKNAIIHISNYGPTFGGGYDINIVDKCNINKCCCYDTEQYGNSHALSRNNNFVLSNSYEYSGNQLCGGNDNIDGYYHFKVIEY
eukprot:192649_1